MKTKLTLGALLIATLAFASNFRTGQVSVLTSAASAIGSTAGRVSLTITNTDTANPVYCGPTSAVTSSTGLKIPFGAAFTIDYSSAAFVGQPVAGQPVYCIATGGTVVVTFLEDSAQ